MNVQSSTGLIAVCAGLAAQAFAVASPVDFSLGVSGFALTPCGGQKSFTKTSPFTDALTGDWVYATQVSGATVSTCNGEAAVAALAGLSAVSGSVGISASDETGGSGSVSATYEDSATLEPPAGFDGGVTFGIIANYDFQWGLTGNAQTVEGQMVLKVFDFDRTIAASVGAPGTSPPSGRFTGLLDTHDLTFVTCPCVVHFRLQGAALATGANGTYITFSDPVSFRLPPGWTYRLASDAVTSTSVPELNTSALVFVGLGFTVTGAIHSRRKRT